MQDKKRHKKNNKILSGEHISGKGFFSGAGGKSPSRGIRILNACLTVVILILLLVLLSFALRSCGRTGGKEGSSGSMPAAAETNTSASAVHSDETAKQAVVDSYTNLGYTKVEGYLNIRKEPSTSAEIIGKLQGGAVCEITGNPAEGWYQISSGGIEGFVTTEFILTGDEAKKEALANVCERAVITADSVNIRKEPNTESEVVAQALRNERYEVRGEMQDGWIPVTAGFISADFAERKLALNEARKLDLKSMVLNFYTNPGVSKVDNYLNIRDSASPDGKIIGKMTSKCGAEILGEEGDWYRIQSGPVTGYVKKDYIATGDEAKQLAMDNAKLMAIISDDVVNARTEPNTDATIWTQLTNSERYDVLKQEDGWVAIEIGDDETAYVKNDYVDVRYAIPEAIEFSPVSVEDELRAKLVNYALQFVGNKYVWGGNDPHTGADCSGFVKYVYQHVAGITLERTSRVQATQGKKISESQLKPGDLIFYKHRNGVVGHVSMYIGNGQIVHAANRRRGIIISSYPYMTPSSFSNMLGD